MTDRHSTPVVQEIRGDQKVASEESRAIAQTLKAEMQRLGRTQDEFATALGISPGHMSKLINGRRDFQLDQVVQAAAVLGVPAYTLAPQGSRIAHLLAITAVRQPDAGNHDGGLLDDRLVCLAKQPGAMTPAEARQAKVEMLRLITELNPVIDRDAGPDHVMPRTEIEV